MSSNSSAGARSLQRQIEPLFKAFERVHDPRDRLPIEDVAYPVGIFAERGSEDPEGQAAGQRARMEEAFEDALVGDFDQLLGICGSLHDPQDAHVLAAVLKVQAATIFTDNLKDFPAAVLAALNIEARSTDAFIADTIALAPCRAEPRDRHPLTRAD